MWATDVTSGGSQLVVPHVDQAAATADGRMILYSRGGQMWRAGADATHATPIARVPGALTAVAPDGSAFFYISGQSGLQTPWIVDLRRGGPPRQFANLRVGASGVAVSADSKWVALVVGRADERQVVILPIEGGAPVRRLPAPPNNRMEWTPDGKAIAWRDSTLTNIWVQPIDGSAAHALTHFTDQTILAFGWSPDGSRLALFRGVTTSDIVLLKGIR
jgi:Tol biopolymer transport system component